MNVLGLLVALGFGALLSSCEQKGAIVTSDHEQKVNDVHQAISAVFDRFTDGVKENPCLAVGAPQTQECFYVITILKNKDGNGIYEGKFSKRVCEQNVLSGNPFEKCDASHWNPAMHRFKVNGSPNLYPNEDYDFWSQPPSDVLACRDQNGRPTTTCVERTTDLKPVP